MVPDHIPLYSNVDNYSRKTKYLNKYIVSLKELRQGIFSELGRRKNENTCRSILR